MDRQYPQKDRYHCIATVKCSSPTIGLCNNQNAMDDTMSNAIAIRILEKDNNRRGDLFFA